MFMTPTSVAAPRHIRSRRGLRMLRRELNEKIGLAALVFVLFAVTLFAGTTVFLVRSVLTSYDDHQVMPGVTETQSR